jgi:hypothetical protein
VWEETMASNSVLKSARESDFHDSDPLAELSRIMGLAREDAANAGADFQIDLEQELMGAFSDDEPRSQANDAFAAAAPVESENEFDEVFSDIFEQESFDQPLDLATEEPVGDEVVADEVSIEDDFVEAFAADDFVQSDLSPADEMQAAPEEFVAVESGPEDDLSEDLSELETAFRDLDAADAPAFEAEVQDAPEMAAEASSEPVAEMPQPEPEVRPELRFEPALSLEDELSALLGASAIEPVAEMHARVAAEPAMPVAGDAELDAFQHDEAIAAEFEAAFDDAAHDEVASEEPAIQFEEPDQAADEWTAEQAVDLLFDGDQADELLPNPLSVEHLQVDEEPAALAETELAAEDFDDISFDDVDLDFALNAEPEQPPVDEIVVPPAATPEFDAADDLESAIAGFGDDNGWTPPPAAPAAVVTPAAYAPIAAAAPADSVAETRAAPVSTFNWQTLRSTTPTPLAARAPEPVAPAEPDYDDADPFAALAALAAAPPIMKTLSRTNPVAVNPPVAERAAPRAFVPPQPVQMPAATAPVFTPPVQRTEPVQPKPVAPAMPLGLRPALPAAAAASAFTASLLAARPAAAPAVPKPPVAPSQPLMDDDFPDLDELLDGANFAPDVDTVDIQDEAVALADDFDIPDFDADVLTQQPAQFDDLDDDFTSAFNQLSNTLDQRSSARPAPPAAPTYYVERSAPAAAPQLAYAPASYATDDYDARFAGFDASLTDPDPFADSDQFAVDPYDQDLQEDDAPPRRSRGLLIGAIVAGVAIAGGIGAYALSFGGAGGDDVPALVKADPTPVKVKPETPGGVVVPNQDGKVYQQVSGAPAPAPAQEKLISTAEEPIAPAAAAPAAAPVADAALPGVEASQVKSEERVTPADTAQTPPASQEGAAITPKKVRTMIVRPDGTLVAREELPAAPAAATPAPDAVTTGMTPVPSAADPATMAAVEPATVPVPSAVPGAQDDVSILPPADEAETEGVATPSAAEVIIPAPRPTRTAAPAAEPVRAAAPEPARAVAPEPARPAPAPEPVVEVASAPAAAPSSLWSVQIASQPTREGAQASYEDLARRYGSVLGGKGVNIVQAEVSGKGTMWRVRVPSASKNDANILCAKLKTAGGSCFVSQ